MAQTFYLRFSISSRAETTRKFRFRRGNNWAKIKPGRSSPASRGNLWKEKRGGRGESSFNKYSSIAWKPRWCNCFGIFFFFLLFMNPTRPVNRVYRHPHTFLDAFNRWWNFESSGHRKSNTLQIDFHRISEGEIFLYGRGGMGTILRGNFKRRYSEREENVSEVALTLNRHLVGEESR